MLKGLVLSAQSSGGTMRALITPAASEEKVSGTV